MSLLFSKLFDRFIEQSPICVMARTVLENLLNPKRINQIFKQTAKRQYTRELLFSTLVDLMGQVVLGIQPSIHAAYQAQAKAIGVSDQAVYDKLNHVEPAISAELVRDSARQIAAVIDALDAGMPPFLKGYNTKILDGNHLAASEHRIEELRTTWAAPLPGKALVVLDPRLMLVRDIFLCQDGQAQERSMLDQVLLGVEPRDLWIADRNFCTFKFMGGIEDKGGFYIIRQHGQVKGQLVGDRKKRGNIPTGKVFEQQLRITDLEGKTRYFRRITVELKKPTRDGDMSIHLLTNLPAAEVSAALVAELYARRWTVETMFQELTTTLTCEIKTLGYPKAALFGFCLALMAYHAVSVIKAALRCVHGADAVMRDVSGYYLSLELSQTYAGMMIAIEPSQWEVFGTLDADAMAKVLRRLARTVDLRRYQKHPRGPKKPPPKKSRYKNGGHVSTAKLLARRLA